MKSLEYTKFVIEKNPWKEEDIWKFVTNILVKELEKYKKEEEISSIIKKKMEMPFALLTRSYRQKF